VPQARVSGCERALRGVRLINSDLHRASLSIQQSDMPNVMSKMMLLGMSFPDVLLRSTCEPGGKRLKISGTGDSRRPAASPISQCSRTECVFAFKDACPASAWAPSDWSAFSHVRAGRVIYERPCRARPARRTRKSTTC